MGGLAPMGAGGWLQVVGWVREGGWGHRIPGVYSRGAVLCARALACHAASGAGLLRPSGQAALAGAPLRGPSSARPHALTHTALRAMRGRYSGRHRKLVKPGERSKVVVRALIVGLSDFRTDMLASKRMAVAGMGNVRRT